MDGRWWDTFPPRVAPPQLSWLCDAEPAGTEAPLGVSPEVCRIRPDDRRATRPFSLSSVYLRASVPFCLGRTFTFTSTRHLSTRHLSALGRVTDAHRAQQAPRSLRSHYTAAPTSPSHDPGTREPKGPTTRDERPTCAWGHRVLGGGVGGARGDSRRTFVRMGRGEALASVFGMAFDIRVLVIVRGEAVKQ